MDSNAFYKSEFESAESGFDYDTFEKEEAVAEAEREAEVTGKNSGRKVAGSEAYDWVQCIVTALLFCVIVFSFFFRIIGVIGISMVPTFHDRDRVLISNLFYEPEQGDIVVLRKLAFSDDPIIKRVIATEGQTVEIDFDAGIVYVDDVALNEPYIAEVTHNRIDFDEKVTVPENCVFVMGDNRNNSNDSRNDILGCIDERYIIGKVLLRVVPLSGFGRVE